MGGAGGMVLSAGFLGLFPKKRPYEEADCADPLNTALSYAWIKRRMEGDTKEALEVFEWVQGQLGEGVKDPYVTIRFHDQSGDFRFQMATRPAAAKVSEAERYSDFERAILHYSLAYKTMQGLPNDTASRDDHKAQLRILQLKSAQCYWALGSPEKAEAVLRKALEGQAAVAAFNRPSVGFVLAPVTAADYYAVESVDIFNGRALLTSSEALLGFCHERLGLFLAGTIPPMSKEHHPALSKEESARLREAKEHVGKALALTDAANPEAVQHAFLLAQRFVNELIRLQHHVQATQFLIEAGKTLRAKGGSGDAAGMMSTGLAWLRAFEAAIKTSEHFIKIPPLSFAG